MASKLRRNRREALKIGLARGATIKAAAETSGYSERQAHRLIRDESFAAEVEDLRTRLVDRAIGLLAAANSSAVRTLRRLLKSDSGQAQLGAANAIIAHGLKLRESARIAARQSAIEKRLDRIEAKEKATLPMRGSA